MYLKRMIKNINNMDYIFEMCNDLKPIPFRVKKNNNINKYQNEINLLIKVEKKDINKKIYFLANKYYDLKKDKYIVITN